MQNLREHDVKLDQFELYYTIFAQYAALDEIMYFSAAPYTRLDDVTTAVYVKDRQDEDLVCLHTWYSRRYNKNVKQRRRIDKVVEFVKSASMRIENVGNLFKHALTISFDYKKKTLQDIAFQHVGLPAANAFKAVTPEDLERPTGNELLARMQDEYGFDARSVWRECRKKYKTTQLCCTMSHLLAIYYAKTRNWPYVFVLEDDAWPNVDAAKLIQDVIEEADRIRRDGGQCRFILCGNSSVLKRRSIDNNIFDGIDRFYGS